MRIQEYMWHVKYVCTGEMINTYAMEFYFGNLKCRDYFGNLAVDERVMKLILELGRGYGKGVLPQAKVL